MTAPTDGDGRGPTTGPHEQGSNDEQPPHPRGSLEHGLVAQWRTLTREAQAWSPGEELDPVLEALALTVALELTGGLHDTAAGERAALRKLGQRALLQVGGQDLDEDELEALRMCAALARDGLRALRDAAGEASTGGPATISHAGADGAEGAPDTRVVIPPADLTRLLRGELDGFAAASLAMKVRRSAAAQAELSTLLRLHAGEPARTLALAAASAEPVLDPARGRMVGVLPELGAEAVLFEVPGEPRRLAIYAEDPAPLRLLATELTTEDVREGYWVGRLADGAQRVEATLEVGEQAATWTLDLGPPASS